MEEDVFAGLVGLQSKASSAKIAPAPAYHVRPQPVLNTRKNRVQTACTACKKRKTKCDGNIPSCDACKERHVECVYELDNDRRRRDAWMRDTEQLRQSHKSHQMILSAIQQSERRDVEKIISVIRSYASLQEIVDFIKLEDLGPMPHSSIQLRTDGTFEEPHIRKTTTLMKRRQQNNDDDNSNPKKRPSVMDIHNVVDIQILSVPAKPWTEITDDSEFVSHLIMLYFTWDRPFHYLVEKELFLEDMLHEAEESIFCSPILVNAILAHSCQYSDRVNVCSDLNNKTDKGHQFFEESKRLFQMERGRPKLTTAQALAIMSIRELGLGRDTVGWMYAGMCFQMFFDLELHLKDRTKYHGPDYARLQRGRNVAAWGIYGLEKLWCLVLNRSSHLSVPYLPKPEIADRLEHEPWYPYPQVRQTIPLQLHFTFSAHCQLNEILGELLKSCYTNDDEVPLRDIESFFLKLTSWRYTMSDNLQDMEDITPYNLNLLIYYHSIIITLLRSSITSTAIIGNQPATTSRQHSVSSAIEITNLLWRHRNNYTLKRTVIFIYHPIFIATLVHLFNLHKQECIEGFVRGISTLHEISQQWPLARFLLYFLKLLVKQTESIVPTSLVELLYSFAGELTGAEIAEGTSMYPIKIGGWQAFSHNLIVKNQDGHLGNLSDVLDAWDDYTSISVSQSSSIEASVSAVETPSLSSASSARSWDGHFERDNRSNSSMFREHVI